MIASVFFATGALGGPSPALFQLDGNAVTDPSPAIGADDWDKVFNHTSADFSNVFVPYSVEKPSADTTAWTPSTKATDDISAWSWQTNTSVINAKADITDAFAAAYKDGANTVMYFGLDRFDESGDANVGFWFLQDQNFKLNADGTFSGQHQNGDVFIQSQFLNGGGIAVPVEFQWQNGALVQVSTGAICTSSPQDLCAIDNDGVSGRPGTITVPWTYQDKDGNPASTITANGFFEGGFNLNAAFGNGDLPCFTHFIAQTGTSGASGNSETLKDLAAGDVQSCGTIQLKKVWVGTAGTVDLNIGTTGTGTGAADVATAHVSGGPGQTAEVEKHAGTYYVSESLTDASSYTTTLACFNDLNHNGTQDQGEPAVSTGAGPSGSSSVALGIGGHVICTYTNTRKPHLTLVKQVVNNNGGTATASQWTLSASSGQDPNNFSGAGPTVQHDVTAGVSYSLAESGGPSGYAASAWVCVGGTQSGSSITLSGGQSATCTITNDDIAPKLHLRKVVVNDNGGTATTSSFTLTADGAGSNDLSGTSPVDSGATLQADTWTLSEGSVAGYAASAWACTGGQQSTNHITVGIGGEATCTITNDDIAPKLHLRKVVVNDNGGTKTAADFTLTADGTGSNDLSGTSPVDGGATLRADTWTLSEATVAGYAASAWVCSGGQQSTNHITVGIGGEATCTITNDDIAPKLHLRKVVVNDNGGTKTVADFTLTANGTGSNDLSGTSPVDGGSTLQADTWALSETQLAGYTASSWVCVGGQQSGSSISVGIGGEATCTITNDDVGPKLIVIKHVINDNGGTKTASDFAITVTGNSPSPATFPGAESPGTQVGLTAGSYSVDEGVHAGYTETLSADCSGTVALGDTKTCTITNDDIAPKLHLRKVVVNNDGGTATTSSFTLTADGAGSNDLSGTSPVDSGATLQADTWTLSETTLSNYTASSWVCVGGTQSGNKITVGIGGEATCTITNDDVAPPVTPPPPPPPAPKIDLQITKAANPTTLTVGSQVTWTMVVTNNGPSNATGVTMADPIPAGMTYVSATSTQGTCTGGALVNCTIGAMNVGASVTITMVTTAAATGTITNTATTVGNEQETNTANNTASAQVTVNGVFTPPVTYCTAVTVSPKQLFVGRTNKLTLKLRSNGKAKAGVKVRIKGSTIRLTTRPSNGKGVVKQSVKPMKAGIVVFQPVATKSCKNPRIGVIGVFTPPVTG